MLPVLSLAAAPAGCGAKAVELDMDDTLPFTPESERAAGLGLTSCSFS